MNHYVLADWTTKQNIAELVEAGEAKARLLGRPVLVSLTERVAWQDATAFFAAARAEGESAFLWTHPTQQFALAGRGVAHAINSSGDARFAETSAAWQALVEDALVDGLDTLAGSGPTLVGGFSFDPQRPRTALWRGFGDGAFVVPRYQLTTHGDTALLTENRMVGGDEPLAPPSLNGHHRTEASARADWHIESLLPPEEWKAKVAQATEVIRAGEFEKLVLARAVQVSAPTAFDLSLTLAALQSAYPWAYTFAIAHGKRTFMGATPERLVGVAGGIVRATALAGTTGRGATPDEDAHLGAALMASDKNRHEHEVVVQMLRGALAETALDINAAPAPQLLKLANVQHLYTPVSGRLRPQATLMDLIARLHPTPAVGGLPSAKAVAYIRDHEGLDRGWYAAPVGWMDARKEGDFAVALRSGLVEGNRAVLFAGCGIVADSEPEAELAETELKLQPMLRALQSA